MITDTFNPSAGEGAMSSGIQTSWANCKAITTGSTPQATPTTYSWRIGATQWFLSRAFAPFDTSSLPDDAIIDSARFRFYRDDSLDGFFNADSVSLILVPSTQASNTVLASSDFDELAFSNKGSLAFSSTSNNQYNNINITDLDFINKSGYTKFAIIDSNDFNNSQPTGRNTIVWQHRSQANPPILEINYHLPTASKGVLRRRIL